MFEDDRVRLKIFLQGLIFAIPVVGQLALLGWTMSTYDNVRRGNQSMARVGFPVLRGLRVLVPAVLYYLLISIPEVILFVLRLLLPTSAVLADAVQVYNYVGLALYALVLVPAIVVADRDGLAAAADVRNVLRAMAARPEATLVVGAGVVIASTIAFMGFILVVGVLFTSVYAAAVVGGLSAWWHAQVFPEEVAAGG